MITRKEYMQGETTHQQYYAQFCTPEVLRIVSAHIGVETIKASTDLYFNDIPLKRWDALQWQIRSAVGAVLREANGVAAGVSLSDCVCVAKEAARILKESPA